MGPDDGGGDGVSGSLQSWVWVDGVGLETESSGMIKHTWRV